MRTTTEDGGIETPSIGADAKRVSRNMGERGTGGIGRNTSFGPILSAG